MATPAETVTAEPPVRVPPSGLVPMAKLTEVVLSVVSTLPLASSTATVTAGVIAEPADRIGGTLDEREMIGRARSDVEGFRGGSP